MALNNARARKPVVFGRKKSTAKEEASDDTLDMLLHYAKAGMESAEAALKETPDLFNEDERVAFEQNKNMLEQAPFLIDSYKSKVAEYDALHSKMLGILQKCEEIVATGDDQAKDEIKGVLKKADVFTYTEDGDLVVKRGVSQG